MRIVIDPGFGVGNADLLQNVDRLGTQLFLVFHAVGPQPLLDLPADGIHRVQHRIRLLEHHRRLGAAHFA